LLSKKKDTFAFLRFKKIMSIRKPHHVMLDLLRNEKKDISNIYVSPIMSGLVQLSLPLGIQAIIGFVLGGAFSTSLSILIALVILGVLLAGFMPIQQMKIIEKLQQKILHHYAFSFKMDLIQIDLRKNDTIYFPELMNRFLDISGLQKGLSKVLLDIPLASIQII
jgi:hypothetical protein